MGREYTSAAFDGRLRIADTPPSELEMTWSLEGETMTLEADLGSHAFTIRHRLVGGEGRVYAYPRG